MGFVDDTSDSEAENTLIPAPTSDDEEAVAGKESSPFLPSPHRRYRHRHRYSIPRTPTSKNNDLLATTRLRRQGITESDEIWDELEDEAGTTNSPSSPYRTPQSQQHRRVSSARTTPLPSKRNSKVLFFDRPSNNNTTNNSSSNINQEVREEDNDINDPPPPTETTGLLARASTGRSYRSQRRRRSAPLLSIDTNPSRHRRRSEGSPQEAVGGWWKMGWWREGGGGGKGKGKGRSGDGGGDGGGAEGDDADPGGLKRFLPV